MSYVAVDVQTVSKRFRLYHQKYTTIKERIIHAGRIPYEDLWALKDVAFEVKEGETVGILGRNGSGKSTLLKCICGVLQPTSGQVVVRGQLAGLLELGAGFQPELSGRENVYLNGSMLGLSKREVDRVFDDVVDFAELEQFIDNQVKFYSSGMYVRLGFAVAVNVNPDVLVIDEVLAVGDERFQRKCMERIKQFQREGRTILFVSHSPDQVRSICDRAVVLSDGHMIGFGAPGEAVRIFREVLLEAEDVLALAAKAPPKEDTPDAAPALVAPAAPEATNGGRRRPVRLDEVRVQYPGVDERPYLLSGQAIAFQIGFDALAPTRDVVFTLELRFKDGDGILGTDTELLGQVLDLPAGPGMIEFVIDSFPLLDGAYDAVVGIRNRDGIVFDWREQACRFEVMNLGRETGLLTLPWRVNVIATGDGFASAMPSAKDGT
jgi:ABC-2 type transport system ATP-binding protein